MVVWWGVAWMVVWLGVAWLVVLSITGLSQVTSEDVGRYIVRHNEAMGSKKGIKMDTISIVHK